MCLWNRYEKEFEKVNDVFELQVRRTTTTHHSPHRHHPNSSGELVGSPSKSKQLTIAQRNLNNCFAYDLVPSPSVITAALRAARRVNDFPSAVRVFEGTYTADTHHTTLQTIRFFGKMLIHKWQSHGIYTAIQMLLITNAFDRC